MADPRTFSNLRNILAQLYPDAASTRRVAHDAGLSATRISFSTIVINTWHTILAEAENVNKVDALLAVVLEEYGDNPALREACEAYRSAVQSKDAFPNDFRNDFKQGDPPHSGSLKTPTVRWLWRIPILLLIIVGLSYMAKYLNETRTSATPTPPETTPATAKATSLSATSTPALMSVSSPTIDPTSTFVPSTSTPLLTDTPTLQAGATRINPKDGAVYAYVPAGEFLMGAGDELQPSVRLRWEIPQHMVFVDAFWIMQTEVTNAQYERCINARICIQPVNDSWNDAAYAQHPVTDVSWSMAKTYAEWVGGRLPTEAEWEKGCRGTDGRIYPWGNQEPSTERLNFTLRFDKINLDGTKVVGSYPAGVYGLYDMSGNVAEWTSSQYRDYPYSPTDGREDPNGVIRVRRGGSFGSTDTLVRCTYRDNFGVSYHFYSSVGFRVALSNP